MTYKKQHHFIDRALKGQKVRVLENAIHTQIAQYLNLVIKRPSRWHTVEVSNQAQGKAAMLRQMALKRKGVVTGWPDIEIFFWDSYPWEGGWYTIFLEVKAIGGELTEKQAALHEVLREDGHSVYVVHSVDEVKAALKESGVIS